MESLNLKHKHLRIFEDGPKHLSCARLFFAYYEMIPNVITLAPVNQDKVIKDIEQRFASTVVKKHVVEHMHLFKSKVFSGKIIYFLSNGLTLEIEDNSCLTLLYPDGLEATARQLIMSMRKHLLKPPKTSFISLVVNGPGGLRTIEMPNTMQSLSVKDNYNDDFALVHVDLLKTLKKKNSKGLHLLYGRPGTGKSTYLRYLAKRLDKKVIFLSRAVAERMDEPDIVGFLLQSRNTIFILEDAEDLLLSRTAGRNNGLSILLNLTDGMLGECLGIQVICTFNNGLHQIDKALLRKGRLITAYEFKALAPEKTKN